MSSKGAGLQFSNQSKRAVPETARFAFFHCQDACSLSFVTNPPGNYSSNEWKQFPTRFSSPHCSQRDGPLFMLFHCGLLYFHSVTHFGCNFPTVWAFKLASWVRLQKRDGIRDFYYWEVLKFLIDSKMCACVINWIKLGVFYVKPLEMFLDFSSVDIFSELWATLEQGE